MDSHIDSTHDGTGRRLFSSEGLRSRRRKHIVWLHDHRIIPRRLITNELAAYMKEGKTLYAQSVVSTLAIYLSCSMNGGLHIVIEMDTSPTEMSWMMIRRTS